MKYDKKQILDTYAKANTPKDIMAKLEQRIEEYFARKSRYPVPAYISKSEEISIVLSFYEPSRNPAEMARQCKKHGINISSATILKVLRDLNMSRSTGHGGVRNTYQNMHDDVHGLEQLILSLMEFTGQNRQSVVKILRYEGMKISNNTVHKIWSTIPEDKGYHFDFPTHLPRTYRSVERAMEWYEDSRDRLHLLQQKGLSMKKEILERMIEKVGQDS